MFQTFLSLHNSNFLSDKLVLTSVTPASSAPVLQTPKATSSTLYFDSLTVNGGNGGVLFFFFQAADGIRSYKVTGVQTCALPIFICIIPALAGLVGDRYLSKCKYDLQIGSRYFLIGKLANALLIAGVSYVGGVLLAFHNRGKFIPLLFLQAIFVSAGSLVPPLVFILVALVAYRLRRFASP